MKYRRHTSSGDYSFGQGGLEYLSGQSAVAQAVKTKLRLLTGEWWEDTEDGLPLFQRILLTRGTEDGLALVDLIVKDRIMDTPHVRQVTSYQSRFDREKRQYSADIVIDTEYGRTFLTYETGVI